MRELHDYEKRLLSKGYRSSEIDLPKMKLFWEKPNGSGADLIESLLPFMSDLVTQSLDYFGIEEGMIDWGVIQKESKVVGWPTHEQVSRICFRKSDREPMGKAMVEYAVENPRDGDGMTINAKLFNLPEPVSGIHFSAAYWLRADGPNLHLCGYHLSAEQMDDLMRISGLVFNCEARKVSGLAPEDHEGWN